MANQVNILYDGDTGYTAVYVNGTKVSDTRGSGNEDIILENVLGAIDKSVDKTGSVVKTFYAEDYDFSKIWIDREGFVPNWADVERAKL